MNIINAESRRTAFNISGTFLIRLLRYPFLLIFFLKVPELLGPYNYGLYALIVSLVMLLSEIFTLGMANVFGKYGPEYLHKENHYAYNSLFTSYFIYWLLSGLIIIIASLILYTGLYSGTEGNSIVILAAAALILENLNQLLYAYLYGLNYVVRFNANDLFRTAFRLIFIVYLYPHLGLTGIMYTLMLTPLISMLFALYSLIKLSDFRFVYPDWDEFYMKLKFGLSLFAPMMLFFFQQQSGPLLLKLFNISPEKIGFFDLANQGFLIIFGLSATVFQALIPVASKFEISDSKETVKEWILKLFGFMCFLILLIAYTFLFFGEQLIPLFLSKNFVGIYPIAVIILFSLPFWIGGQAGYVRSVSSGNPKPFIISMVLSTIVFFVTALTGIYFFESEGIAFAYFFSGGIFFFAFYKYFPREYKAIGIIMLKLISVSSVFVIIYYISIGGYLFFPAFVIFTYYAVKSGIINIKDIEKLFSFLKKHK